MNNQISISYTFNDPAFSSERSWWAVNGRDLSLKVINKITDFLTKFRLYPEQGAKVIKSIFQHPNQLSLESFLDYCLAGKISFVFLSDRAGVGEKHRARDVFSFESLEEMAAFSEQSVAMTAYEEDVIKEPNYRHNVHGKDGRFISLSKEAVTKESAMEIGTRIHEHAEKALMYHSPSLRNNHWYQLFTAHTPPPIPANYDYYRALKLGTPEYKSSRQFVINYVCDHKVSVRDAIRAFNRGVEKFGEEFESLVVQPHENSNLFPPPEKVIGYINYKALKDKYPVAIRSIQKRFKEVTQNRAAWMSFLKSEVLPKLSHVHVKDKKYLVVSD